MKIAIDLDGTLCQWKRGPGHGYEIGEWIPGAQDALHLLLASGHKIYIHTCRATWLEGGGYEGVREFFDRHGFHAPQVEIWNSIGKPIAAVYIDDRAVTFRGDWNETILEMLRMVGVG